MQSLRLVKGHLKLALMVGGLCISAVNVQVQRAGRLFDLFNIDMRLAVATAMLHIYGMLSKLIQQAPPEKQRVSLYTILPRDGNTSVVCCGLTATKLTPNCDNFFSTVGTSFATIKVSAWANAYVGVHTHVCCCLEFIAA